MLSNEVFAIAMPVSNPGACVTNGKSRLQTQVLMMKVFCAEERSQKRGIGALPLAVFTVESGANDAFTVTWPRAGRLFGVLETKATPTAMLACSMAAGSELT